MANLKDYQELAYEVLVRRGKNLKPAKIEDIANDIIALKGLIIKHSLRMEQLSVRTVDELDINELKRSKANYLHYCAIKIRNPEIVSKEVERLMDNFAKAISKWEGEIAFDVASSYEGFDYKAFKDYSLNPKQMKMVEGNHFYAFVEAFNEKNMAIRNKANITSNHVTIFLDETNKDNPLSHTGAKISNYSYIIVNGSIGRESQINSDNIICEKIGQATPTKHVEEITCEAIGHALFTLLYEYNYTDNVIIRVDNKGAKLLWNKKKKRFVPYGCFRSVRIKYVNRKKNTKADALSRENVVMTLSRKDFNKLIRLKQIPFPAANTSQQNIIVETDTKLISLFKNQFKRRIATL